MSRIFFIFLITTICFYNVKSVEVSDYLNVIQNLNTKALLEELIDLNNITCVDHLKEYVNGLAHLKLWALKMLDSSAKVPDGLLKGHLTILGEFDECIEVEHPQDLFIGQYCLMNIDITLNQKEQTAVPIKYGICVPSTCSSLELSLGFNAIRNSLFNHSLDDVISFSFPEGQCRTKEPKKLRGSDWVVICILIALGAVVLANTCYDIYVRDHLKNDKPHPLLIPFSIYTNGKALFQIIDHPSQLKPLHGIRVLSICWVVLVHAYIIACFSKNEVNILDVKKAVYDINHVPLINAIISVDTFFFIGGFLMCTIFFRDMKKKGNYDALLGYIHRYIRLTPVYGALILIFSTVYIYFGDGPLWYATNQPEIDICTNNWWSGILYIQSFVDSNANCVPHTWYLSTDMHFYWIAPLILYPMYLWQSYIFHFLAILLLASVATNFSIAYVNDAGASLLTTITSPRQMEIDYVKFYMRATPYIIGLATGYICLKMRERKLKIELSKKWVVLGWFTSTCLCLAGLYGIRPFTDLKYTTLEASIYLALHRVAWSLGLAWIVFACLHDYGGLVNTFLSLNIFQPLGRLSYCVYLIHGLVQLYHFGSLKTNYYAGDVDIVYFFLGDLVLSFLLAIPVTLIFEIPFGNIERYLFRNVSILPLPSPDNTEAKEIIKNKIQILSKITRKISHVSIIDVSNTKTVKSKEKV